MPLLVNQQRVSLESDAGLIPRTEVSWEVEGPDAAELRLTESNQGSISGHWRLRAADGCLVIQRATAVDWATHETMITLCTTGVGLDTVGDDVGEALEVLLMKMTELREFLELVVA